VSTAVKADTFATLPNQGGGKIVITDERCVVNGRHYEKLNRAYFYTSSGTSGEGCWTTEGEVIVIVWESDDKVRRYPMENFTLAPKYKNNSRNNRGSL
jgi:hypothetical protein